MNNLTQIRSLIRQGAVFYCSTSGGKDSDAMSLYLEKLIPADQLVFVHADLGVVEWTGVQQHIHTIIPKTHTLNVVQAVDKNGDKKDFFSMVTNRGMWPSAAYRQCTSDLKRNPIMKFIRHDLKAKGKHLAVNCMGLRAEESSARAKKNRFEINKMETLKDPAKRTVYNWNPIFDLTTEEVFDYIRKGGKEPFWAYKENERLSCVFCIMGSKNDLQHGARSNPLLYRAYVELEQKIGHTMFMKKNKPIALEDHVGIRVEDLLDVRMVG